MHLATHRLLAAIAALPTAALFVVCPLHAADRYWDINGITADAGPDSTPDGFWYGFSWGDSAGTAPTAYWNNADSDRAFFSAGSFSTGAFTIIVNGPLHTVFDFYFQEGTVTLADGTGALELGRAATDMSVATGLTATIAEPLTGSSVGFAKIASGTLILSGGNTYTGATAVNAGVLNIRNSNALGTTASGTTVASGATLQVQGGITVGAEALTLSGTGVISTGALRNISGTNDFGGLVTLAGNTRISSDAGTLTLSNPGTITGATFGLTVGGAGNTTINSILGTTSGTLTKDGAGTLTLTGANTYTGLTTVSAGVLNIQNATALGTTASGTTVASGAALQLQGGVTVGSEALTLNGTGVSSTGALRNISGTNDYAGFVTLGSATRINSDAGTLTLSNASTITGATFGLTVGGSGDTAINGILGMTSGTLTKDGSGTLTLSGANIYTGATTVNAGTLQLSNNLALQTSAINTAGAGVIALSSVTTPTFGGLTGTKDLSSVITSGYGSVTSLTLNPGLGTTNTYSGAIADGAAGMTLTKSGAGTQILTGANTYTGLTTVSAGALNIQNTTALGTTANGTTVGSGAALQLQGGITVGAEALTLNGNGITSTGALRNISGSNDYTGLVTLGSAARINSDAGTLTLSNPGTITGATFGLTVGGAGNTTINSVLGTTSGTLTKDGTGTLTLSAANTYTGITTVSAGVLNIQNANALGTTASGTTVASGAALQLQGGVTVGAEALTLNGTGVSSTGALRSISGTNDYAGLVTLSGATRINSDAGTFTLSNPGTITGATFGLTVGGAGNTTINSILGTTSGTLTKDGAGILTLSAANTYTGLTTVSAGVLNIQNATALGTTANGTTVASGAALQLQGGITVGAEALTLNGTGISSTGALRNISGTNDYAGLVTLGGATRINSDAGTLTLSNAGTITGSFGLTVGGSGDTTINSVLGTTGATLTKDGTGTLTLTGANTHPGATTTNAGTLQLSNNLALQNSAIITAGAGVIALSSVTTPTFGGLHGSKDLSSVITTGYGSVTALTLNPGSGAPAYSGVIADGTAGMTLTKSGAGTQILTGANTYTGTTTVSTGALNIQNATALGTTASGTTVASGAALQLQGGITVGAEALTLSGNGITSTGALRNISGSNDYTGLVTLGGATRINSDAGTLTLSNPDTITGATIGLTVGGSGNTAINSILGTTSGTLTKDGAGTLTLTGANTYTGLTTVSAGVLNIQNTTALGTTANGTTVASGAALQLQGGITVGAEALTLSGTGVSSTGALRNISGTNDYTGLLTLGSATRINSDAGTLTLSNTGSITGATFGLTVGGAGNTMINSILGTTSGTLTKDGAGTLTLTGVNSHTGLTTLSAGTLSVGSIGNGGVGGNLGAASNAAANLVFDGGTLQYTGATASTDRNFTINAGKTATFDITTNNLTVNGTSAATSGALTKSGAGTLTLSGANTHTGATTINAGTLQLSNNLALQNSAINTAGAGVIALSSVTTPTFGGLTGSKNLSSVITTGYGGITSLTLNQGSGATNNYSGAIADGTTGMTLTKSGAGTQVLTGANTYTGATTLSAGTLSVGSIGNGGVSGNLGAAGSAAANLVFDGGTLQYTGATASTDRNFTINAGKTATFDITTNNLTVSGASPATSGALTKSGAGTLTLTGANAYTGATTINAGTLTLGASERIADASGLTVASGATFNLANQAETVASLAGAGNVTLGSAVLASGGLGSSTTFSGVVSGTGGLTKVGVGTLTLSGANTYTGATTVNSGTLRVDGRTATGSAVTVASGATLGGGGTVAGTVAAHGVIAPGADLAAGNVAGLRTGTVTFSGTGSLVENVGPVFNDSLVVAGTANLAGTLTVNATNPDQSLYTLLSATSITGAFTTLANIPAGYGVQVTPTQISLGKLLLTAPSLTASDGATNDIFGASVSQSGTISLVGAYLDDSGANTNQGSAYVFRGLDTATGTVNQNVKLTASDGAWNDQFGFSVSLSGKIGLVGAYADDVTSSDQGSAYVFRGLDTATGTVTQNVKLIASDGAIQDYFGNSVSLSGTIGLVGAHFDDFGANIYQGSAYVFRDLDTATGTVTQNVKLTASDGGADDYFGNSVSLSGTIGLVGATGGYGSAYVFRGLDTATGTVTQNVKLTASSDWNRNFGASVSLSGTIGLVGASYGYGSAYVFRGLDTATGTVTENVLLLPSDGAQDNFFGNSVSLSGTIGLVGAIGDDIGANTSQGSAYVFRGLDTATGTVTQNVKLTASDGAAGDLFGSSVSLSGDQFTIGAYGQNSARGKAYTGTVSSLTTLDLGGASRTIDGISFVSQDDWIIGQTTDSNQVTLTSGDSGTVTASGKAVFIGQNAGSDNNTLVIAGTLTATQINIGAAGNTGNVLQLGNGGTTGSLSTGSTITNHGTFAINRSNTVTQGTDFSTGAISGTGGLTQMGTGTTTLTAANTYTGATIINAGTLTLGAAERIANTSALTVASGATFNLANFDETVGSFAGAGNITLGSATLTAGSLNTSTTFSGTASGTGGLTKAGTGTLTLSGPNTYTGATAINVGVLNVRNATALGTTASGTTVASGAALEIQGGISVGAEALSLNGTGVGGTGALLNVSGNNTYGGPITLAGATTIGSSAGTLTLNGSSLTFGGNAITFAGAGNVTLALALGGADGFTKTGAGRLTLGAAANTTGTVTLAGGTLDLGGLAQTIGTLEVTGNSILDFSGVSTLNLTHLTVAEGVILTVTNWLDAADFFYSANNPGGANLARVQFTDFGTGDTRWLSFDNQVTPVPEPATYGAVMLGAVLGLYGCRRSRRQSSNLKFVPTEHTE